MWDIYQFIALIEAGLIQFVESYLHISLVNTQFVSKEIKQKEKEYINSIQLRSG